MKTDVFYWVLNAGILGSAIGLGLLLVRRVKRIPRRAIYGLWALPLLRLWMPFGLGSSFSVLTLLSRYGVRTVALSEPGAAFDVSVSNVIGAAQSHFPVVYKTDLLQGVFTAAAVIWAVGACALLLAGVLVYGSTRGQLKERVHLRENVYLSRQVTAPMLFGILRPRILIPHFMAGQELTYVLLHEEAHIRRGDNFFRCVALVTAALHWYNPLIWLFLKCYLEDLELSCDEAVIAGLPEEGRRGYALALVDAAEERSAFVSAFGGARIRVRVEAILAYRALPVVSALLLALFVAAVAATLLTNGAV